MMIRCDIFHTNVDRQKGERANSPLWSWGYVDQNQREFFRFSILQNAKFRLGLKNGQYLTSWGDCLIVDMSGGGCRITTPLIVPVLTLRLNLHLLLKNRNSLHSDIV